MPKALVSAEAFGFGPPAKLTAICSELARRSYECHFAGHGTALAFAEANADRYTSITAVDSMLDFATLDASNIDLVVSVMEPALPAWARAHGIPCLYVDSLFWMWDWPIEERARLDDLIEELAGLTNPGAALEAVSALSVHLAQYVAHHLASVSCVQNAPGVDRRLAQTRKTQRFVRVGAIVDLSQRERATRDIWLATGSGMLNPLRSFELAVEWVSIVAQMLHEAARLAGTQAPIVVAGNACVLAEAGDVARLELRPTPLDHRSMLRTMNRSIGCLTPPGLTTIFECAAYGVPVILLPEQHYAHPANFHRLARTHHDAFPHGLINDGSDPRSGKHLEETLAVADRLRAHAARRDDVWDRMVAGVAAGMAKIERRRDTLVARQRAAIEEAVGGYGGTAQVGRCIDALVGHSPRAVVAANQQ